jgi:hypothetical protein
MTNEELAAFVKKNPVSVGCGLLSAGLLLSLYFRGDLKGKAEERLAEKSATGERYAANIKNSAQLEEDFARLSAANKEIDARAVQINQLGINSQFFYKLEGETGVKLIDFRQNTQTGSKGKGAFIPVAFTVSVQGDLPQLLRFLRLLESGAHYCRVLTATMNANATSRSNPMTLTLSLELLGTP